MAAATADTSHPQVQREQAKAAVRILRGGKATRQEWERQHQRNRREVYARDGYGRLVVVRLIEYE